MKKIVLSAWALTVVVACSVKGVHEDEKPAAAKSDLATVNNEEVSLKEDRSHLEELRKEIPAEVKRDNDEIALFLNLMAQETSSPEKIRDKWYKLTRDRRSKFDKQMNKLREAYNKKERVDREAFQKDQKQTRENFVSRGKHKREEQKEFYDEQDGKRREYFAEERDRRRDFESDMQEKRKDYEDYMREKNNRFNDEYRAYSKEFYEREKAKALKKQMQEKERQMMKAGGPNRMVPGAAPEMTADEIQRQKDLEELKNFPASGRTPLGPDDQ